MSYSEDDFVPLSAVTHYAHCPRRCALVHTEGLWHENRFTAEGNLLHDKAHSGQQESRRDVFIARSLLIHSASLGLSGVTDVVEFHRSESGVSIPGHTGKWVPYPVEYKRGAAKNDTPYRMQLCAQTICLEETFGLRIDHAALFVGVDRRRVNVTIDEELRSATAELCGKLHAMLRSGATPCAEYTPKCRSCSLVEECMPENANRKKVGDWLLRMIETSEDGE